MIFKENYIYLNCFNMCVSHYSCISKLIIQGQFYCSENIRNDTKLSKLTFRTYIQSCLALLLITYTNPNVTIVPCGGQIPHNHH